MKKKLSITTAKNESRNPIPKISPPKSGATQLGTPKPPCARSGGGGNSPPESEQKCTGSGVTAATWIVKQICESDEFVFKALKALFWRRQTSPERRVSMTFRRNGAGFSKANAKRMSRLARKVTKAGRLSGKDLAYCRAPMGNGIPRLGKYRVQLAEIFGSPVKIQEAA